MIQSQSFGGTPQDSGGGAKGGDRDLPRGHSSINPSHRSETGEHRIHRHDSRDLGANSVNREWRRPPRGNEVYRRDDRGFKDRWKERKRWDRPRFRDNDLHRDSFRPAQDYNRPRVTYDEDRPDDRPRFYSERADTRRDQRPSGISGSRRDTFSDTKGPKKFSRRPGDKFRDLINATEKTGRPQDTNVSSKMKDPSPKASSPDILNKLHASKEHTPKDYNGRGFNTKDHNGYYYNRKDNTVRENNFQYHSSRDNTPQVPTSSECNVSEHTSRDSHTSKEHNSKQLNPKEISQLEKSKEEREHTSEMHTLEGHKPPVSDNKFKKRTSENTNLESQAVNQTQRDISPLTTQHQGPSDQVRDATETTSSNYKKEPNSLSNNQKECGSVMVENGPSSAEKGFARTANDHHNDQKGGDNKLSGNPSEEKIIATSKREESKPEESKPVDFRHVDSKTMEFQDVQMNDDFSTTDEASTEAITMPGNASESHMDVDPNPTAEAVTDGQCPNDTTHDINANKRKTQPLLPQELTFRKNLATELSEIVSEVGVGTYDAKTWPTPIMNYCTFDIILNNANKTRKDIEARYAEAKDHKKHWLEIVTQLDGEVSTDPEIKPKKPKSVSTPPTKPQQQPTTHSRKRSRDEDATVPNSNRRNRDRHSRAHGDVARSEAEFLEILANLEAQTARDPLVRARLTSARIPDQDQTPNVNVFQSTNALVVDHSVLLRRLDSDHIDNFTEDEHIKFIEAYVQSPKEFGKIALAVGRSFNECVMHYYRTKKQANYKQIVNSRTKKKRGRKPKKRVDDEILISASVTPASATSATPVPEAFDEPQPDTIATRSEVVPNYETTSKSHLDNDVDAPLLSKEKKIDPQELSKEVSQEPQPKCQPEAKESIEHTVTYPELPREEVQEKVVDQGYDSMPKGVTLRENAKVHFESPRVQQRQSEALTGQVIPPPVLPLHQMETLATAALLGNATWSYQDVKTFEGLLSVFGPSFEHISFHMGKPVEQVQLFYNENKHHYENLLQQGGALQYQQTHMPAQIAPGAYVPQMGTFNGVINGPPTGIFVPRFEMPPVQQPASSAISSHSGVFHNNRSMPLPVPPPVLPLNENSGSSDVMSKRGKELSQAKSPTAPLTPSPPDGLQNSSESNGATMQVLMPMSPAIPPILPRSINNQSFMNAHCGFWLNTFNQFDESNERHL